MGLSLHQAVRRIQRSIGRAQTLAGSDQKALCPFQRFTGLPLQSLDALQAIHFTGNLLFWQLDPTA
jgi:hypothetical protein